MRSCAWGAGWMSLSHILISDLIEVQNILIMFVRPLFFQQGICKNIFFLRTGLFRFSFGHFTTQGEPTPSTACVQKLYVWWNVCLRDDGSPWLEKFWRDHFQVEWFHLARTFKNPKAGTPNGEKKRWVVKVWIWMLLHMCPAIVEISMLHV